MTHWPILLALTLAADDIRPAQELAPRQVRLQEESTLEDALKTLQEQTGNIIVDRRTHRTNPRLRLRLQNATFWQALDEIVATAGCGYSVYQEDGKLALVDTPLRKTRVSYDGIFRTAFKRVTAVRDVDSGSHSCIVSLELAWEPRFQPFFLNVGSVEAMFGETKVKSAAQGDVSVTGRLAFEFDVRLPAPPRTTTKLTSLEGSASLLGPTRMLTFEFADLKPGKASRATKEGVQVGLTPLSQQSNRWSFGVTIANPPGGPKLDSFQAGDWLGNNEIALKRTRAGKTDIVTPLASQREDLEVSVAKAHIQYHFTRDLPPSPSGWSLVYRTPGRIVTLPATFALKDIPLP